MEPNDTTSTVTPATTPSDTSPQRTAPQETAAPRLPLPEPLKAWLTDVRKPALSLQYRIDKRHVPDLNAEATTTQAVPQSSADSTVASASPSGKNSDLMTVTGDFTIRYFDLCAGMLGLLLAGCLLRGCCRLTRAIR